jgi:hypothetical protein
MAAGEFETALFLAGIFVLELWLNPFCFRADLRLT